MTWMLTVSGKSIDLDCIADHKVTAQDIAYSLSNINRFTGHALRNVSVAEHSLMVCAIAERQLNVRSPSGLLAALMHDAHKYLTGDVSAQMKLLVGPAWDVVEERIQRDVLSRFGLLTAFHGHRGTIKAARLMALTAERQQLMFDDGLTWPCETTHPAPEWVRYGGDSAAFTADEWRQAFINRFNELTALQRQQQRALDTPGPFVAPTL